MSERLLVSVDPGMVRAVRMAGGKAQAFRCLSRARPSLVGEVRSGRVTRVVPALDAAFVDCGLERDAFLAGADAPGAAGPVAARVREGEALAVQATSDPRPGKGARVSARIRLAGRLAMWRPDGAGVSVSRRIAGRAAQARLRAAARRFADRPDTPSGGVDIRAAASDADIAADLDCLARAAAVLERADGPPPRVLLPAPDPVERALRDLAAPGVEEIVIDDSAALAAARRWAERCAPGLATRLARHSGPAPLFEAEGAAEDVALLAEARVPLANGGALTIQRTEALCAIDVDSAGFTGRGALALNLAAAEEAARQLRLRDIGGLAAVDFVGVSGPGDAAAVEAALRAAAAADDAPVRVAPMSPFGVVELTRRRAGAAPDEVAGESCPCCGGAGRRKAAFAIACEVVRACLAEAAARPGRRLAVRAAPDVLAALDGPLRAAVAAACEAEFRSDPARARETFEVFAGAAR